LKWKYSILNRAYKNYKINHLKNLKNKIDLFFKTEQYWLDDYTLYMSIKFDQNNQSWSKWPKELKQRDKLILEERRPKYEDIIHEHIFLQYIFFQQWNQLKEYANKYNVTIIGGNNIKFIEINIFHLYRYAGVC
jgi:4-alpha-glucanotransferase